MQFITTKTLIRSVGESEASTPARIRRAQGRADFERVGAPRSELGLLQVSGRVKWELTFNALHRVMKPTHGV